jgi:crotonobetainyl-CoA:carnitine CoA-transferase CaiB-like acyl-CoA transferase
MQGVVVVELAGSVAGAWCGRLLAHLGAEVILVEPPRGSSLRARPPLLAGDKSPWHHWLNAGKASVVAADDAEVEALVAKADCVICTATGTEPEGSIQAWAEQLRKQRPTQVFAAVSAYGLTGPWSSMASSELTEWAAGGHLFLTGDRDREPVQGGGPWPEYFTATNAVLGIQAALLDVGRTGVGQLVDVGAMEAMAAAHQWTVTAYTHTGYVKHRDGNRLAEAYHPVCVYECSDGWVQIAAASVDQWEALCILTDCVELLADDGLITQAGRYDRADDIDAAIGPWFAEQTAADAVEVLQGARVPASVVNDLHDVLSDEQLQDRRYWSHVPELGSDARVPGPPFMIGERQPAKPVSAPELGAQNEHAASLLAGGPCSLPEIDLTGVRVLEFSIAWAGPLAGRCLADLGADVIKVEHPTARGLAVVPGGVASGWEWGQLPPASVRNGTWPSTDPGERWFNRIGMFNKLQRNKRSLCLDVKAPGGEEVLRRLVEQSDVVLNNYSPRGVKSLGIDHETLSAINPSIITVSMSGYGATGPMASHYSLGPILETHAGLASLTGYPDGGPLRVGVAFPDPIGGLHGAVATLAALWRRAETGLGQFVDLSQLETLLPLIGDHLLTTSATGDLAQRQGNRSLAYAPQGVYRCGGDDAWLAVTVRSDQEWERLAELVASPELQSDRYRTDSGRREHHDLIDAEISSWTRVRGKFEAMAALQSRGIAAMAVLTSGDLVDGPQLQARDFIATIESLDAGPQRLPGNPIHFSSREVPLGPSPILGQHNSEIVGELLGYDTVQLERLVEDGALAKSPPA